MLTLDETFLLRLVESSPELLSPSIAKERLSTTTRSRRICITAGELIGQKSAYLPSEDEARRVMRRCEVDRWWPYLQFRNIFCDNCAQRIPVAISGSLIRTIRQRVGLHRLCPRYPFDAPREPIGTAG